MSSWRIFTMNQMETEKCDEFNKLFYKQASSIIINIIESFFNKNTSLYWKVSSRASSRSSRPDVFCEKDVLRNFAKFTRKHLCQSLFFNKVAGMPATLLKKRLLHRCFPVNFAKFLRTPFLKEHLRWLLLIFQSIIYWTHLSSYFWIFV